MTVKSALRQRVLRIIAGSVFVLLVLPTACFLYVGYKPQLLLNPITRYLYPQREAKHGARINLIPDVFAEGEREEKVVARLLDAGFERWNRESDAPAPPSREQTYRIGAGGNIACAYEFFIYMKFSLDGTLLTAENQSGGVCL